MEKRLQNANAVVRSVVLLYDAAKNTNEGVLVGIRFFDVNNTMLLESGWWFKLETHKEHRIYLQEGERILGFKSGRRGDPNFARHFDFQLIIGKMVE